ncbi:Putative uncharacterized protein [Staphylococcus xylosus]|nr:Putative uncharacterized protein [Staphylococcus xylosus]
MIAVPIYKHHLLFVKTIKRAPLGTKPSDARFLFNSL